RGSARRGGTGRERSMAHLRVRSSPESTMARSTPERQTLAGRRDPVDSPLQHAHSLRGPHPFDHLSLWSSPPVPLSVPERGNERGLVVPPLPEGERDRG